MKKITAIALGNLPKQGSIKFLKEAINCIPLANENGADFENAAFIFNPPTGQFIVIAGKGD